MRHRLFNDSKLLIILSFGLCFILPTMLVYGQTQPRQLILTPLRWSTDGSKLAIPIRNTVDIRDAVTHQLIFTLDSHTDVISSVAWSPDGKTIATASHDHTIKLWQVSNGSLIRTLSGNDDITFITWTPDSQYLISSGFDVTPNFFVWNPKTGDVIGRYVTGAVQDGSFSPDGKEFAYVNGDDLRIRNSTNYDLIAIHRDSICCSNVMYSIAWSLDGTKLVTGSANGLVTIWNSVDATVKMQFEINEIAKNNSQDKPDAALSWVRDVRFSDDGTTVSAIAGDGTFKEWNVQTGAVVQATKMASLATASWSPYGARLAVLDASFLPALDGTPSQKHTADTGFQVTVPNPTLDRLNTLATVCVKHGDASKPAVRGLTTKAIVQSTLAAFDTQVKALPTGTIPAACQADLLAMSAALQKP